jgi:small subunit ribosomal protein S17
MSERGNKKTMIGLVASDKMNKTVVVEVTRRTIHPMYHKYINRRKRYQAHDETNDCHVGDRVLIEECRPMSARKNWRVKQILERAV